jgi:hypothetical protein
VKTAHENRDIEKSWKANGKKRKDQTGLLQKMIQFDMTCSLHQQNAYIHIRLIMVKQQQYLELQKNRVLSLTKMTGRSQRQTTAE